MLIYIHVCTCTCMYTYIVWMGATIDVRLNFDLYQNLISIWNSFKNRIFSIAPVKIKFNPELTRVWRCAHRIWKSHNQIRTQAHTHTHEYTQRDGLKNENLLSVWWLGLRAIFCSKQTAAAVVKNMFIWNSVDYIGIVLIVLLEPK